MQVRSRRQVPSSPDTETEAEAEAELEDPVKGDEEPKSEDMASEESARGELLRHRVHNRRADEDFLALSRT